MSNCKHFYPKCQTHANNRDSVKCVSCGKYVHQACIMEGKILPNEFKKLRTKSSEFHFFCALCCESKLPFNKAGERTLKSNKATSVHSSKQASTQAFVDINKKIISINALEKEAKIKIAQTEENFQKELASQAEINEQLRKQIQEKEARFVSTHTRPLKIWYLCHNNKKHS